MLVLVKVRNAVAWAKSIQNALDLWGKNLTSVFGVHNWPRFGNEVLEKAKESFTAGEYQWVAEVTVTMSKEILYELATTNEKPNDSDVIIEGNICKWHEFLSLIDVNNPAFNIVTPIQK